jgi:CxxC motif-containing protein (DUF1111 family)
VAPAVCAPPVLARASAVAIGRHLHGRDEFMQEENVATGLGPVFNGTRCGECHREPTVGGSSARNVTLVGAGAGSTFDPLVARGGPLLQVEGIATAGCTVAGEVAPAEATVVAERNTPPLFGAGLIEAIPETSIRRLRDRQRAPLSGRLNVHKSTHLVGRFGWKAQVPNLQDFAASAYRDELGITTPVAPEQPAPQGVPAACGESAGVEDDGEDVAAFVDFMTLLAPLQNPPPSRDARQGRAYFRRSRCQGCHVDTYRTDAAHPVPALRRVRVPVFSDLLVHDMGPELADGIVQESAGGSEFRTAPLWGVRFSAP